MEFDVESWEHIGFGVVAVANDDDDNDDDDNDDDDDDGSGDDENGDDDNGDELGTSWALSNTIVQKRHPKTNPATMSRYIA